MNRSISPRLLRLVVASALLLGIALVGCAAPSSEPGPTPVASPTGATKLLAEHGLTGLDAAQIIARLDTMPVADRPADLIGSVRPDVLVLTDASGNEARLPMPADKVYISVAPYREQTHECYFHSLTTCLGELGDQEVRVVLTASDGEVLVDKVRRSYDNGFVGLWVPRGIEATLTIEHEGQAGTADISTMEVDNPTCITTLRVV
ncbi:CueP family metal-binding protein [Propionibacteriaceae bacterium Y2011]